MQPPVRNDYWLNRIRKEGVRLTVEIDLTFEQFRQLLEVGIGCAQSDTDVLSAWKIANRRILPPEAGSFMGIGSDVGEIFKEGLQREHKKMWPGS